MLATVGTNFFQTVRTNVDVGAKRVRTMVEDLGLVGPNGVEQRQVKRVAEAQDEAETSRLFKPVAAPFYRNCTMRAAHQAQDHLDTAEFSQEPQQKRVTAT